MNRWATVLAAVIGTLIIGAIGYQLGVSHGLALGTQASGSGTAPVFVPYGYYRPWGFGFGFLFPFAFFAFWFLIARGLFWGGRSWRRERFEEWHRRAHEAMKDSPTPNQIRS